jgi:uncharacterized protein (DUF1501 family)
MNRRNLLKFLAAAPLATSASRLFAAPETDHRFLLVFMRGGYDCASLLVPYSSSFYYESRPNIAIARPDASVTAANVALDLDGRFGLNPALRDTIYPLYQKGQVAFLPFTGTDDLTRSHFETQDSIELGQTVGQSRNFRSGFLNRLVATLSAAKETVDPIAFTDQLPVVFQGTTQIPNMALKSVGKPGVDDRQGQIIAGMYRNTALAKPVNEGFEVRDDVMKNLNQEMDASSRNAITAKGFEGEARRIARMMQERFTVGFVDVGGWDTHVGQGNANGYLSNRLGELGRGLAAYADEMGPMWKDTTVVVVSEFGRTFRENGNRGTDHGHGSVYWVLGGSVRGGRIAGEQAEINQAALFQNRDYPVLNDYRSVMGGLFARLYGLNERQVQQVFPGAKPIDLRLA